MPSEPHVNVPLKKQKEDGEEAWERERGWDGWGKEQRTGRRKRLRAPKTPDAEWNVPPAKASGCVIGFPVESCFIMQNAKFQSGRRISYSHNGGKLVQPPLRSLSLPQQNRAGLKLPFHCGQRFRLSVPVKSSEKSGLVNVPKGNIKTLWHS